jgi:hypothetical protein
MAQDFGDLLTGTKKDANYLVEGYVTPALKSLGAGLNQGWYNTGKPHKMWGVDLTISIAAIKVPTEDEFFTVDNSKLSQLDLIMNHQGGAVTPSTGKGKIPTVFGPSSTQGRFDSRPPGQQFDAPEGVGLDELPMGRLPIPVVNLGFGLPKNTDIKFRYVPTIGSDEAKFSLFGIGLMHDIKQWMPGIKLLPFDLSGFVGFTRMSVKAELDDDASKKGNFGINATTVQAVISKKLSVLTFYGGAGYNFVKSNLEVTGTYDLNGVPVKDPIDLSLSTSSPRFTAGMRLKLAVFTIHGDYSFQKYSALTVGFGINVR